MSLAMRLFTKICFAIACLNLVNGASPVEESKVYSQNFNFHKKDVLYSIKPFWKDEMVYAVNQGSDTDKQWKVYMESTNLDRPIVRSCDVDLTYKGRFGFNVALFNAGDSKAVFVACDGDDKIKLISVNLKGCRMKETNLDVPNVDVSRVILIPREDNYDVVFQNKQLCSGFLCKATFDYEGKLVKKASPFLTRDADFTISQVESNNNAYLAIVSYDKSTKVYLVHDKERKLTTLFSGTREAVVGLSAEENKLAYCANNAEKLQCKKYDAKGKAEEIEFQITTSKGLAESLESLDTYNLENGLLVMLVKTNNGDRNISITRFDEHGRQAKSVNVDLKCNEQHNILYPKMYKNSNGQYCVTSICLNSLDTAKFSRSTRCLFKSELF